MFRRMSLWGVVVLALAGTGCGASSSLPGTGQAVGADENALNPGSKPGTASPFALVVPDPAKTPRRGLAKNPIIIPRGLLSVIDIQNVPAQREGVLEFIGTEIKDGETVPEDQQIIVEVGTERKVYRKLNVGDQVKAGQLLGQLDNRLARDDLAIRKAKVTASEADFRAAEKTRDEAQERWNTAIKLRQTRAISEEDWRAARLGFDRYYAEAVSKEQGVELAKKELSQAHTQMAMHEIRSKINGEIKAFLRHRGEAVKNLETVFEVYNLEQLRVKAQVELQHLPELQTGMKVVIEPTYRRDPEQTFGGHQREVTSVAVSKNTKTPQIVSGSRDGTVRVWERTSMRERRVFRHPSSVEAVACTPPGAAANLCLAGVADGRAWLWDLDNPSDGPIRELKGQHRGAVTSVAFSTDGNLCATGGDLSDIHVWDTATGELRYRCSSPQRGAVTTLQFTPDGRLVSSVDSTVRLWTFSADGARAETMTEGRSKASVSRLSVSPDGKRMLFEHDKELRLMSLPDWRIEGALQNPTAAEGFTSKALFSPDGRLALAVSGSSSEGRLQLWRLPTETTRGYALRHLVTGSERSQASCGAFAPDGSFIVTGNKEGQVFVWSMPTKEEVEQQLTADVKFIGKSIDSSQRQVELWAELKNPDGRLLPGDLVTIVVYPSK
jgi:WD40 repeat protein